MLRAFVTGAASGIGRSTVALLKAEGWWVAGADRDPISVPCDMSLALDVTDRDAWTIAMGTVSEVTQGHLNLLVNSAGLGGGGPLQELSADRATALVRVNILGTCFGIQAALPMLQTTGDSRIVNLGSMLGYHGVPGAALYGATKAAVHNLSQAMDLELAGVTVQAVSPGIVATPLAGTLTQHGGDVLLPEDVAKAILGTRGGGVHPVGSQARWVARLTRWWPDLLRQKLGDVGK